MRLLFAIVAFTFIVSTALSQPPVSNTFPAFSASGDLIAFSSNRDGDFDIYLMEKDGSNIVRVTDNTHNDYWPSWLGDSLIIFDSNMNGNEEIYSIRVNGTGLNRLTFDTAAYDGVANVSKNGWIAFDSNRQPDRLADVWIMNIDGSDQKALTAQKESNGHPSLSPEGDRLLFKIKISEQVQQIFELHLATGTIEQITHTPVVSYHPSYSPDGKNIVFASNEDGDFEIYTFNRATSKLEKQTDNDQNEPRPTFSPDRQAILYGSRAGGTWEIWIKDLRTGESRQLTR